jgi:hypothetical protein
MAEIVLDPTTHEGVAQAGRSVHELARPGVPTFEDLPAMRNTAMRLLNERRQDETGVTYELDGEAVKTEHAEHLISSAASNWLLSPERSQQLSGDAENLSRLRFSEHLQEHQNASLRRLRDLAREVGYGSEDLEQMTPNDLAVLAQQRVTLAGQVDEDVRENGLVNMVALALINEPSPVASKNPETASVRSGSVYQSIYSGDDAPNEPDAVSAILNRLDQQGRETGNYSAYNEFWHRVHRVDIAQESTIEDNELSVAGGQAVDPEDEDLLASLGFLYADEEPVRSGRTRSYTPRHAAESVSLRQSLMNRARKVWDGVGRLHNAVGEMLSGIPQLAEVQAAKAAMRAGAEDTAAAFEQASAYIEAEVPRRWALAEAWLSVNVPVLLGDIKRGLGDLEARARRQISERMLAGALGGQALVLTLASAAERVRPPEDGTGSRALV